MDRKIDKGNVVIIICIALPARIHVADVPSVVAVSAAPALLAAAPFDHRWRVCCHAVSVEDEGMKEKGKRFS